MHLFDGVDQVGQAFEREVFALHGHNHTVGRAQAVEGEHAQGRRAVNEHEVVVGVHGGQGLFEAALTALHLHQLDLGASEFAVGAQHPVAAFVGQGRRLGNGGFTKQHVVDRQCHAAFVDARAHGGVALRVQIDQQHALTDLGQTRREVDRGGGFAHPALLVRHTKNLGHMLVPLVRSAPLAKKLRHLDRASFRPNPIKNTPASFSRVRPMRGLARMRSAR